VTAVKVGKTGFDEGVGAGSFDSSTLVDTDRAVDETVDVTRLEGGSAGVVLKGNQTVIREIERAIGTGIFKAVENLSVQTRSLVVKLGVGERRPERIVEHTDRTE